MITIIESQHEIKTALERVVKAMTLRDAVGKGTALTSVRLDAGLICHVEEGDFRLTTDMSPKMGGTGTAPNPGVLGRAALGSCFATSFAMWAARAELPFESIDVEVEADYDARGELGVDPSVPPGYLQVRFRVTVRSDAPKAEIGRILEQTERFTSWVDLMRRPVETITSYHIERES